MGSIIACDSTNYERWKPETRFNGLIGVSVQIDDPIDFKTKYETAMSEFFKKNNLVQEKKAYCSNDLLSKFFDKLGLGHEAFKDALEILVSKLCEDTIVHAFHATCNTLKYPKVTVFVGDASLGKSRPVPTMEFMRDWFLSITSTFQRGNSQNCLKTKGNNFLLDGFRGPITEAWNELSTNNKVEIVGFGDECNAFVSAADLIARYIDEALGPLRIEQANIQNIKLPAKEYHVQYCFHNDLRRLIPLFEGIRSKTGRQINFKNYWKSPTIYILKEGSEIVKEDNDWLKKTLFFKTLCDLAFDSDASIKFYDRDEDRNPVSGDRFVYYGPRGKEKAEEIKTISEGLGIGVDVINSKDLAK